MKDILVNMEKAFNHLVLSKHSLELRYWKECYKKEGNRLENDFYAKLMLGVANETDDDFLKGKVVGDFGCGPRGSLVWAKKAAMRIGIDVLANRYIKSFPNEFLSHNMIYVTCTEQSIPVPNATIDILYTVNALDHVENLDVMCSELRRILKPGGLFIGSFNLNHKARKAEPQILTEDILKTLLFRDYEIIDWRVSAPGNIGKQASLYEPFFSNKLIDPRGGEAYLWAKVMKV